MRKTYEESQIGHSEQRKMIEDYRACEKKLGDLSSEADASERWSLERKMIGMKAAVIEANIGCVKKVAKWFRASKTIHMEELVGIGKLALVQSFESYDLNQSKTFYSYSSFNAKRMMSAAIGKAGTPSQYPVALLETASKIHRMIEQFEYEAGGSLTLDEVVAKFKYVTKETLEGLARLTIVPLSLDRSANGDRVNPLVNPLFNTLKDNTAPDPSYQATIADIREVLPKISQSLSDAEKMVIALLYGIRDLYALEIRQIANEHPKVMARIKEIHKELSAKMGGDAPELIPSLEDFFCQPPSMGKPTGEDLIALGLA